MVKPLIMNLGGKDILFWNITSDVGPGCPNRTDDVELVRFGYHCMGTNPRANIPADRKAAYASVSLTGGYDSRLGEVIRLHQAGRGGTQDGKISSMKNATGSYGGQFWIIASMNGHMAEICGTTWPRIDLHHRTSPELTLAVSSVFKVPQST